MQALCYWSGSTSDFDIYIYTLGQNILTEEPSDSVTKNGYYDAALSYTANPENLTTTIATKGQYYVRANLYTSTVTNYRMVIKVNNQIVVDDYSSAMPAANGSSIKQFTTSNICKTKIYYTGPNYPIYIYGPGMTLSSTPLYTYTGGTGSFDYDVTQAGTYSVVVFHNITADSNKTTLTAFTLNIKSTQSSSCVNSCSNSLKYLRLS